MTAKLKRGRWVEDGIRQKPLQSSITTRQAAQGKRGKVKGCPTPTPKAKVALRANQAASAQGRALVCQLCGCPCKDEDHCSGCSAFICFSCDRTMVMGHGHQPEEHYGDR